MEERLQSQTSVKNKMNIKGQLQKYYRFYRFIGSQYKNEVMCHVKSQVKRTTSQKLPREQRQQRALVQVQPWIYPPAYVTTQDRKPVGSWEMQFKDSHISTESQWAQFKGPLKFPIIQDILPISVCLNPPLPLRPSSSMKLPNQHSFHIYHLVQLSFTL